MSVNAFKKCNLSTTRDEVEIALKKLKVDTAAVLNGVPTNYPRSGGNSSGDSLVSLYNVRLSDRRVSIMD